LTVNPLEAALGKDVTVSVLATNAGDLTGSFNIIFKIDNTDMKTLAVTLKGQESQTVSFSVNSGTAGDHIVNVNNLSKTYRVKESSAAPQPTATASPEPSPKPAATPVPTKAPTPTTAPKLTPVAALPFQPTDNRMRIMFGIIGGIFVTIALVYLLTRPRRAL
jgi:hypothetical protein